MKRRRPPNPIASIRKLMELPEFSSGIHDNDGDGFFIGDPTKGKKIDFVLAPKPAQLETATMPGSEPHPCSVCLTLLWVSKTSRKYIAGGTPLICIDCAAKKTGRPH